MAGSPKPEDDNSAATGASEAEAARPVRFAPRPDAGPGRGDALGDGAPDAAEAAGTKRPDGDGRRTPETAPGAIDPKDLDASSDDGAG